MSICRAVMPSRVPATLKSMSPRWSSSPRMSERIATSVAVGDQAHGDAGHRRLASGTPASSMAESVPPQMVAIDDEPLDSRVSDTTRIVYGKSS